MYKRIPAFLQQAHALQAERAIEQLCEQEIDYLYATHTIATAHTYITQYRHAITRANLPTAFLVYMRGRRDASETLRINYARKLARRHRQQYPITNADALVAHAANCLQSERYASIIVGLELLTGRRPYELGVTASFSVSDHAQYVLFRGQAKTREALRAFQQYPIPVLIPGLPICHALMRLRTIRSFEGMTSAQFDNTVGKALRDTRKALFGSLLPLGALHVKEALRKIYGCIAYSWFARPDISVNAYLADILGHGPDDVNTANSYQDFYLATIE